MRRLIQLFLRYGGFFLFLLLEGIAFYMVVQYNKEQKAIFYNSLQNFSTYLEDRADAVAVHFSLEEVVDSLLKENSAYKQFLINNDLEYPEREISVYREKPFQQYILQYARVKKNSINKAHNYLILDKGSDDGIQKHSAVISDKGIVGVVIAVKKKHCLVMSLLNRQTRISAALKNTNAHGSLVWKDFDPLRMNLEHIPKHIEPVEKGDTVVTSGYSAMFPEGLIIGRVDTAWLEPSEGEHSIIVRLNEDLSTLKYVYIVTNLLKEEQLELEQIIQDE
ncbi:MAG: rod shape-determining protein MreC [Bacteroidetes bacterium]|nr:MAG: rod shape-determining protein MreC [Bacteroidota bacterium]